MQLRTTSADFSKCCDVSSICQCAQRGSKDNETSRRRRYAGAQNCCTEWTTCWTTRRLHLSFFNTREWAKTVFVKTEMYIARRLSARTHKVPWKRSQFQRERRSSIGGETAPRGQWLVGRILETLPDDKGCVRTGSIRTKIGIIKRPIIKLLLDRSFSQLMRAARSMQSWPCTESNSRLGCKMNCSFLLRWQTCRTKGLCLFAGNTWLGSPWTIIYFPHRNSRWWAWLSGSQLAETASNCLMLVSCMCRCLLRWKNRTPELTGGGVLKARSDYEPNWHGITDPMALLRAVFKLATEYNCA